MTEREFHSMKQESGTPFNNGSAWRCWEWSAE